jgi:hypothetical protein
MLSWLKTRHKSSESPTFKSRVESFWQWYAANAQRFYDTIEAKRCGDLTDEVSSKIDELLPDFAWNFGPTESGNGHAFTLTGEGNPHKQVLTAYWNAQAPKFSGWTFHATKQPSPGIMDCEMHIDSLVFKPAEFWLTPYVDNENEKIDITVWHPRFPEMDENTRSTVAFLFLDETLGEIDTENWIGVIDIGDQRLTHTIPLGELPSFVAKTREETGWKKGKPGELWTSYRGNDPQRGKLRGDIIAGTTSQFALVSELEDGALDPDPLEPWGADYVFIAFDSSVLPQGSEVDARADIEDALTSALSSAASGLVLGGAMGIEHAYIDLILFDGANSLDIVQRVLREMRLPSGTTIEFFAKSRQRDRIRL